MEEAAEVEPLLQYPDETAGGLMTTAFVALQQDATAEDVIAFLRALKQQDADEDVDIPFYLFVTDDQQHLVGVVDLRELVAAPPHTRIGDLMDPQVIAVDAWTDQEEVARVMKKYDLAAVPVVDDQRRLVGVVTYDDIMHVLEEEAGEDFSACPSSSPSSSARAAMWAARPWPRSSARWCSKRCGPGMRCGPGGARYGSRCCWLGDDPPGHAGGHAGRRGVGRHPRRAQSLLQCQRNPEHHHDERHRGAVDELPAPRADD